MSEHFGDRLKQIREMRHMKQSDLAERANINRITITKYETGRIEPGVSSIIKLCAALEVSSDALLGIAPIPESLTIPDEYCRLTETEFKLISRFRALNPEQQEGVLWRAIELRKYSTPYDDAPSIEQTSAG